MYRIELAPGEVTVFRTIDELATGVRNGVITARARIFHNASQKWLPVEFHPHYKLALELLAGRTIEVPSQKPVEGPRFDNIVTPTAPSQPSAPGANLPYIALDQPPAEQPAEPSAASPLFAPPVASSPVASSPVASSPVASPPPASSAHLAADYEAAHEAEAYEPPAHKASAYEPPAYAPPTYQPAAYEAPSLYGVRTTYTAPTYGTPTHEMPSYATPSYDTRSNDTPTDVAPPQLAATPPLQPQLGAAPVLDLPRISYPEFTPTEQPVVDRAPRTTRGRRPLRLAGAIVVLVAGAYAARLAYSPPRADGAAPESPAPMVADRPVLPQAEPRSATRAVARGTLPPSRLAPAVPRTEGLPSKPTAPPASSGFAAALQSRAIVSGPAPAAATSAPAASDSVTPVAPLAIELDVSVPSLASSESLVTTPGPHGDSTMKRILKAVAGGKDSSPKP